MKLVTGAGIEPAARALKVRCSTTELPGRGSKLRILSERVVPPKGEGALAAQACGSFGAPIISFSASTSIVSE